MDIRDEIASMDYETWIVSYCKRVGIKRPNRNSYAYMLLRGLFDGLKAHMEANTSLKNRLSLLSGTLQTIERALEDEGQTIAKSCIRDIISPTMERIKQWKKRSKQSQTSTSKSSQS